MEACLPVILGGNAVRKADIYIIFAMPEQGGDMEVTVWV